MSVAALIKFLLVIVDSKEVRIDSIGHRMNLFIAQFWVLLIINVDLILKSLMQS